MATGKLEVTTSQLQAAIADLSEKNQNFLTKVNELNSLQAELATQWSGDANTAFNTAYNNDKDKWMEFSRLVDSYITALSNIRTIYDNTEGTNTATASNRTY